MDPWNRITITTVPAPTARAMCTGAFAESRNGVTRPPARTRCVGSCIAAPGRWGANYCWTQAAGTPNRNWGAPCGACHAGSPCSCMANGYSFGSNHEAECEHNPARRTRQSCEGPRSVIPLRNRMCVWGPLENPACRNPKMLVLPNGNGPTGAPRPSVHCSSAPNMYECYTHQYMGCKWRDAQDCRHDSIQIHGGDHGCCVPMTQKEHQTEIRQNIEHRQ